MKNFLDMSKNDRGFILYKENRMKKMMDSKMKRNLWLLSFIVLLALVLLVNSSCKALANNNNNETDVINIVGNWLFTNVLQSNASDEHTRTFTLEGTAEAGDVSEQLSATAGTYTVTEETTFKMELLNWDPKYRWEYVYEGTIIDNDNMSGTMKTTTYSQDTGEVIHEGYYNYTAERVD